ncbi:2-keto-4-pentenoate hydratase/2-oxohepta-3-ene-1,7-dioic acid hydratase in catechol pathway [Amorphus suaedae]
MTGYRLLTYDAGNGPRAGLLLGDTVHDVAAATGVATDATVLGIAEDWAAAKGRLETLAGDPGSAGKGLPLAEVRLLAPVLYPGEIYCAGANYSDHVEEMARAQGLELEADPKSRGMTSWHFIKAGRSVVGTGETVALPSKGVDWEAELVAVIGRTAKNVSVADALDHVLGYTVGNDLSARDRMKRVQTADSSPFKFDWVAHKSFDGACPLGPWIVPADAIADPQNLKIGLSVNGVSKQASSTSQMIFTLAEQIAHLSAIITLHPGDLIMTGTPAGVGTPKGEFLKAGDEVRVSIEGIGEIVNTMA